jgi:uncharacterized membrane protein
MTDLPPPPAAKHRLSGRIRWLLIASLTLNLLVAGVVAGAALRHAGGDRMPVTADRSIGFGPWSGGLDRDDLRALRRGFDASGHDLRAARAEDRADRATLIAALRADPFNPAALDAVAERMRARTLDRLDLGHRLIRNHIVAMTPEARRAFADRLERHLSRGRDRDGKSDR